MKIKNLFFVFTLLFLSLETGYAQNPFWMRNAGGLGADGGNDISIDRLGNTYTTGYFNNSAYFGSNISLLSSGVSDVFLTKMDNSGNFVWAVKAGGTGADRGLAIKTDSLGNCYITGYFNGTAIFGNAALLGDE